VGGFLEGLVERKNGLAKLTFRHRGVGGAVLHEETITGTD